MLGLLWPQRWGAWPLGLMLSIGGFSYLISSSLSVGFLSIDALKGGACMALGIVIIAFDVRRILDEEEQEDAESRIEKTDLIND